MNKLELGIVSDEITTDFREAVRLGSSWGIKKYEIRCLKSGRIPDVDRHEWQEVVKIAREEGVQITALSPGIFKHGPSKTGEIEHELAVVLPQTMTMAKECGASLVIVFGFQRQENELTKQYAAAVGYMRRAAAAVDKERIRIAIENEPGFWCDTGVNTARLIREVHSPALGANWDPCNAFGTSELPYPDGYRAIKEVVINVHVKDTKRGSLIQCVPVGDGAIDWKGQIQALLSDRIVTHVTIETHCLPLVENSRRNVDILRQYMKEAPR
jgi:sugar phosphate isomerase/epimerase